MIIIYPILFPIIIVRCTGEPLSVSTSDQLLAASPCRKAVPVTSRPSAPVNSPPPLPFLLSLTFIFIFFISFCPFSFLVFSFLLTSPSLPSSSCSIPGIRNIRPRQCKRLHCSSAETGLKSAPELPASFNP